MEIFKITLGTAQLGMNYGIANFKGKPDINTSIKILNYAWNNGINTFDTAPNYGNSEKILGKFISSKSSTISTKSIFIITKLPRINFKKRNSFDSIYKYIKKHINNSLKNLGIEEIPIYLLHNAPDIFFKNGLIIKCLNKIKREGLINKFGISTYNPEEVEESLKYREIDVIEIPINIFDTRLIKTGLLKKLKKNNYIVFARSVYLQGLFFISPKNLPPSLKIAKIPLMKLQNIIKEYNINIAKLAFLYIRDLPEITSLLIGTESLDQLTENIKFLKEKPLPNELKQKIFEEFSNLSDQLINPSLWSNKN